MSLVGTRPILPDELEQYELSNGHALMKVQLINVNS